MRVFDQIGARTVEPHTQERSKSVPPPVEPNAGDRWGKPSAFSYMLQQQPGDAPTEADDGQMSVGIIWGQDGPPEYKRIIEGGLKIYSQTVRVAEGGDPNASTYVDVDRFVRMMFYFTEYPPKPYPPAFQRAFTTYYDLHFDLHPVDKETVI